MDVEPPLESNEIDDGDEAMFVVDLPHLDPVRWKLITTSLTEGPIRDSKELVEAMCKYNSWLEGVWDCSGLHSLVGCPEEDLEAEEFFRRILPGIVRLALRLPELFPQTTDSKLKTPIQILQKGQNGKVDLTKGQIASVLANAFLNTMCRRERAYEAGCSKGSSLERLPHLPDPSTGLNFNNLFEDRGCQVEKLKCIINYLRRRVDTDARPKLGTPEEPDFVTFQRRMVPLEALPDWGSLEVPLADLYVHTEGGIEEATRMLQVDFANAFIGGGVLRRGCVQEEILFLTHPELMASILLCERLGDTECLLVSGHQRYSRYKGYASTFSFAGDYWSKEDRAAWTTVCPERPPTTLVAIDAVRFTDPDVQYSEELIRRELNKVYAGFCHPIRDQDGKARPVATGNWGCGAFKGDPQLKSLIQVMAASVCGPRDLHYYTFNDGAFATELTSTWTHLKVKGVSVGRLYTVLCGYQEVVKKQSYGTKMKKTRLTRTLSLFDYLRMSLDCEDEDTE